LLLLLLLLLLLGVGMRELPVGDGQSCGATGRRRVANVEVHHRRCDWRHGHAATSSVPHCVGIGAPGLRLTRLCAIQRPLLLLLLLLCLDAGPPCGELVDVLSILCILLLRCCTSC
jgi:hypothetical protein